jgi:hypothetical protein
MNDNTSNQDIQTTEDELIRRAKEAISNPSLLIRLPDGMTREQRKEWFKAQISQCKKLP